MLILANRRIEILAAPARRGAPVLEAVLLGHCPGRHVPEALPASALDGLDAAGLRRVAVPPLVHLPLAFTSLRAFRDVFPDASSATPRQVRPLPGAGSWLARAVEDFFQGGGEQCWVVVVPEEDGLRGFLPSSADTVRGRMIEPSTLRGFELLTVLPDAGLVAAPDLERLAVPLDLVDPGQVEPPAPAPVFQPCSQAEQPPARPSILALEPDAPGVGEVLARIAGFLALFRPDMQWLHTLPFASRLLRHEDHWLPVPADARPTLDPAAVAALTELCADERVARVIQPLWPCLRQPEGPLCSASGLLAGVIAGNARRQGPWRSIAGRALPTTARPFPAVEVGEAAALRESANIGVLTTPAGPLELDDERLPSAAFARSAEAARFHGWLIRRLVRLAERLVFVADPRDGTAVLAIEQELERLRQLGALTGTPEQRAWTVQGGETEEGQLVIGIELRFAFPIDLIRIALVGRDGRWTVEPGGARA